MKCPYCGSWLHYEANNTFLGQISKFQKDVTIWCPQLYCHASDVSSGVAFTLKRAKKKAERSMMQKYVWNQKINGIKPMTRKQVKTFLRTEKEIEDDAT